MAGMNRFYNNAYHKSKWIYLLLFVVIFILTNIRQSMVTNFHCEICSDKAGYYMYLPALFQLGFGAENYPEGFDALHGDGFHIDRENDRIITKFTCGVAMLLLPFYGAGTLIAKIFSINTSTYSPYYLFFINIGAVFYIVLGLFFLRKWLENYVDRKISFISILVIFFGTNLYYYVLDESLMSHLYSFSMFAILLYGSHSFCKTKKFRHFLLFIIPLSIAILIRPTNILFAFIAILVDVKNFGMLKNKLKLLLRPKYLFFIFFIFFLVIIPQLLYWKFVYDHYVVWSYRGEGFTFWNKPQLLISWFSPQSGLFTYTPIILLSLIFSVVMLIKKEKNAVLVIASFFALSYMCASWYNPFFGICNFGKRPMVEYLPILMLPIAYMMAYYRSYSKNLQHLILLSTIVLIYYNQALFGAFNTCFFGNAWGWSEFGSLLKNALILKLQ